ncbi:MAG TPA: YHS domain-containing (seleno)protein [Gammaproteobacteria bacterium]|nr:YHS domain-containing (seleno)protein [Gammaproteobacteria bacterium]
MNRSSTLTALASALALAGALAGTPAFAADEYNTVPGLTAVGAPLGLHGIDPVAFIEIGNRIDGSARYTAVHDGVAYYFSSKENLEAFNKAPEMYVPQNGGFCTYGVSVGKKFDGDPRYSAVENGKLYVFLNEEIFHAFNKDRAGTIAKAERNWKQIRHVAAKAL